PRTRPCWRLSVYLLRNSVAELWIKIKDVGDGMVYVTSGLPLEVQEEITMVPEMALMTTTCSEADGCAPLFYSGYAPLDNDVYESGKLALDLERSVARIDLVNTELADLVITEVVAENAPSASYVFKADAPLECPAVTLSHTFDEPFKGTCHGVTTLFETDNSVDIRIRGYYRNAEVDMTATLPSVQRNKVYTLNVVNAGTKVETTFNVTDWKDGDSVNATPDAGDGIKIDPEYSVIPQGVAVDFEKNIVTVPATGVNGLKLAFKGQTKIELQSTDNLMPSVTLTENQVEALEQGYVSSFNIDVEAVKKGSLGYNFTMHLRNTLMTFSYDFVEVRVESSPYQVQTVKIGGSEWMCFNATSADIQEQIFLLDGVESVEDMYNNHFVDCIGCYFQYNRPNPYSPWTSNSPTAVTRPSGAWTNSANMPLPGGYHIASAAEWLKLFPAGTIVPSEYTCATGERISVSVVTLPGTLVTDIDQVNNQNYKMRYVVFESLDTGNKLFIPLVGAKANNSNALPGVGNWTFGTAAPYWMSDDRRVWFINSNVSANPITATMASNGFNYDGFCPVRGIKNAQ
ncbi:MAG: hypothetical protein UH625_07900, partial [Muribaculaceae bacterium]|nr:hypothetical protein [Muribaculaceae bacterium]